MGAGKGKTKRTRSSAPAAWRAGLVDVFFDEVSWDEFIRDANLREQNLRQYYCGSKMPTVRHRGYSMHATDYERIVSGLFADAVEVEAFKLAPPLTAEDYEFITDAKPGPAGNFQLSIARRGKPDSKTSLGNTYYWMKKGDNFSSSSVALFLHELCDFAAGLAGA